MTQSKNSSPRITPSKFELLNILGCLLGHYVHKKSINFLLCTKSDIREGNLNTEKQNKKLIWWLQPGENLVATWRKA